VIVVLVGCGWRLGDGGMGEGVDGKGRVVEGRGVEWSGGGWVLDCTIQAKGICGRHYPVL